MLVRQSPSMMVASDGVGWSLALVAAGAAWLVWLTAPRGDGLAQVCAQAGAPGPHCAACYVAVGLIAVGAIGLKASIWPRSELGSANRVT